MTPPIPKLLVRNTRPDDFKQIIRMCLEVYPESKPWREDQLTSHLRVFPEGQQVVEETETGRIVGMAASLIIRWDDYEISGNWRDFTDFGMFTNHDPASGRTLYGAEIMVRPTRQGRGVGSRLYRARRNLVERLGLRRIRCAARLRGYGRFANSISPEDYVIGVIQCRWRDPTLSFQLKHGFEVVAVVPNYLRHDPESLGYAAVIEWINRKVARPEDLAGRDSRFCSSAEADHQRPA